MQVHSKCPAYCRGGVGQDLVPTEVLAKETKPNILRQASEQNHIQTFCIQNTDVPQAGRFGAPGAERKRRVRQDCVPTDPFALEEKKIHIKATKKTLPQRLSRKTNRRNSLSTRKGTQPSFDNLFISSLSAGRKGAFALAAERLNEAFFLFRYL